MVIIASRRSSTFHRRHHHFRASREAPEAFFGRGAFEGSNELSERRKVFKVGHFQASVDCMIGEGEGLCGWIQSFEGFF